VWLCATVCDCMWLCATVCDCMRLCVTVCDCVWLYATVCDCMRLCVTVCDCMRLCVTVCDCVRLCATVCDCVRLHRMLKKWWRSLRVCSTQTSPYMPNLTTTRWWGVTWRLRLIDTEKEAPVTYWIGSWRTPELVWTFWTKKSVSSIGMRSSFPQSSGPLRSQWNDGDIGVHIIACASATEPASARLRSYGCALQEKQRTVRAREDRDLTDLVQLLCSTQATTVTSRCSRTAIDWQFSDKGAGKGEADELQRTRKHN
jgi:hypothetical protein